jgi:hypothetical protein
MRFSLCTVASLLLLDHALAFAPYSPVMSRFSTRSYAADMPPAIEQQKSDLPVIQQNAYGQPTDVRYSDFLKLVGADRIEKVTFSADGTQLLGVDVDGSRVKLEALPNDPELLNSLTQHKVCKFLIFEICLPKLILLTNYSISPFLYRKG